MDHKSLKRIIKIVIQSYIDRVESLSNSEELNNNNYLSAYDEIVGTILSKLFKQESGELISIGDALHMAGIYDIKSDLIFISDDKKNNIVISDKKFLNIDSLIDNFIMEINNL